MNRRCAVKGNVKIIDFMPKGTVTLRFCMTHILGRKRSNAARLSPKEKITRRVPFRESSTSRMDQLSFLILLSAAFNCCTSAGVMDFATCFRMERKDVRAI